MPNFVLFELLKFEIRAASANFLSPERFGIGYTSRQGRQGRKVTGRGRSSRWDGRDIGKISPFGRNDIFPLPLRALRELFRVSVAAVPRWDLCSEFSFAPISEEPLF